MKSTNIEPGTLDFPKKFTPDHLPAKKVFFQKKNFFDEKTITFNISLPGNRFVTYCTLIEEEKKIILFEISSSLFVQIRI